MSGVRQALRSVLMFATACNVQMFEYRVVPLNYIQYMISWSSLTMVFAALCKWTPMYSTVFTVNRFWIVFVFNTITGMVVTGLALLHKKKFQDCLDGLSIINTSLGQIDIPDEYRTLHMSAWRVLGILCFMAIYIVAGNGVWVFPIFGRLTGFVVIAVMNYANFVNFSTFLIVCLILRHVHCDLCRVSRKLNAIFGLQVTLEIGTYFVYVTTLFDYLCTSETIGIHCTLSLSCLARKMLKMYWACCWAVVYIARLIYFNHVCESVCVKGAQFIWQIVNRPLQFDAIGMFYFGYGFVYTFFGAISTVLVIILQASYSAGLTSQNGTTTF